MPRTRLTDPIAYKNALYRIATDSNWSKEINALKVIKGVVSIEEKNLPASWSDLRYYEPKGLYIKFAPPTEQRSESVYQDFERDPYKQHYYDPSKLSDKNFLWVSRTVEDPAYKSKGEDYWGRPVGSYVVNATDSKNERSNFYGEGTPLKDINELVRVVKRLAPHGGIQAFITERLDIIASELEQADPKMALAIDQVSDRLENKRFARIV
jgi:hypothetical protein